MLKCVTAISISPVGRLGFLALQGRTPEIPNGLDPAAQTNCLTCIRQAQCATCVRTIHRSVFVYLGYKNTTLTPYVRDS